MLSFNPPKHYGMPMLQLHTSQKLHNQVFKHVTGWSSIASVAQAGLTLSCNVCLCTSNLDVIMCFFSYDLKFYLCYGYFPYIYVCAACACKALKKLEEGVRSLGTADTSGFELLFECKELIFAPLQEQAVL